MAQKTISQLSATNTLDNNDLILISKDTGAGFTSNKVTYDILKTQIANEIASGNGIWRQSAVVNILSTPPGSPTLNDRYIVNVIPTGAWTGHTNEIATWTGSTWSFEVPSEGWTVWVDSDNKIRSYDADTTTWIAFNTGVTDHGNLTGLSDDDHTQYLNNTRGDARYSQLAHNHNATYAPISHTHAQSDITGLTSDLSNKEPTITATTSSDYYRGDKTFQPLNKAAVGLSNVDNTSDVNKPVSTAQQTALDLKLDKFAEFKTTATGNYTLIQSDNCKTLVLDNTVTSIIVPAALTAGTQIQIFNSSGAARTLTTTAVTAKGKGAATMISDDAYSIITYQTGSVVLISGKLE